MTNPDEQAMMIALAERCEAAIGPSLSLDIAIEEACVEPAGQPKQWLALKYSSSLDAAMTLVPEGWAYSVGNIAPARRRCNAYVLPPPYEDGANIRTGATPALALCAAALRARAAQGIEARSGATAKQGAIRQDESPVGEADAPKVQP